MSTTSIVTTVNAADLLNRYRLRNGDGDPCFAIGDDMLWLDDEDAIHPSAEELSAIDLDLDLLQLAVENGLDMRFFSDLLASEELEIEALNALLERYIVDGETALLDAELVLLSSNVSFFESGGFDRPSVAWQAI